MPTRARARRSRLRTGLSATVLTAAALGGLLQPAQAAGDPGPGDGPKSHDKGLQRQLDGLVAQEDGPPGVIALLTRGDRTEVYTAGVGDIATGRPPHPDDHMRIASIAKAFSGAVALQLVDQGLLSSTTPSASACPTSPRPGTR